MPSLTATVRLLVLSSSILAAHSANQNVSEVCSKEYSVSCLKLELVEWLQRDGVRYRLWPGVYLSQEAGVAGAGGDRPRVDSASQVEELARLEVKRFLDSLVLTVRVVEPATVEAAKDIARRILHTFLPAHTGRKKGYGGALWAAGTVAAVGISGLAAVSGKALMTSMLALMLAGAGAMRSAAAPAGGSNGGGCSKGSFAYIDAQARKINLKPRANALDERDRQFP